jgi:hypothetical protein
LHYFIDIGDVVRTGRTKEARVSATEITHELVLAATTGDAAAQLALVSRLLPIIRARVARVLRQGRSGPPSEHDVQDAAQEVWLALFADRGRALLAWRPDAGMSFDNYVGMIAERRSVSLRRRRWRQIDAEPLAEDSAASACCNEPERQAGARELLGRVIAHVEQTFSNEALRSIDQEWLGHALSAPEPRRCSKAYSARYRVRRAAKLLLTRLDAEEHWLLAAY